MQTRPTVIAWMIGCTLALSAGLRAQQDLDPYSPEGVFLEAWLVAQNAFYDEHMSGVNWDAVREELEPRAAAAKTEAELSAIINDAVGRLHASHTGHLTPDQREYYELLDVFFPAGVPERKDSRIKPGPVEYVGIGLATQTIGGRTYVYDVYTGGPADRAGILSGDELLGVEGGPWGDIAPFRGREGKETKVAVRRAADEQPRDVTVTPALIRPRELFLASEKASARLIERDGKKIAYVRIRSYGNIVYQEELRDLIAGDFASADGLVIDIRGGWGGASPAYMDVFNPVAPALTYTRRDGTAHTMDPTWRKAVAMLIDGGSRSGKECIAYAFKKHRIGTLVGERTAGAVLAGTTRPLHDGSVLYIAVGDVTVDGEHLEGKGVEPDLVVKRGLPYSAGRDEQLDAAVAAVAARAAETARGGPTR